MHKTYRKSRIFEILTGLLLAAVIGVMIYRNVSSSTERIETLMAVKHMNVIIEAAYEDSKEADENNVSKVDKKGYYIVKSNGVWFMVCNLNDIFGGSITSYKTVTNKFIKLMPASELYLEGIEADDEEHVMFLRFSSADANLPSAVKGDLVNVPMDTSSVRPSSTM